MSDTVEDLGNGKVQRLFSILVTVVLILVVVLCLYVTIQVLSYGYANLGGFMLFRVVTGSMEPTIPVGSLLVTRQVDIESIQFNDIVCFRTQLSEIWGKIVTHRVINVLQDEYGGVLLETKGDANLVADVYLVDQSNYVGKVIWYTGDGSVLAGIVSLFTSKIGFLGCIVMPALLLAGMLLKDSVSGIRQDLRFILEEAQLQQEHTAPEDDPLCGMTQQEYNEMYERIKAELMEELMQIYGEILEAQGAETQTDKTE